MASSARDTGYQMIHYLRKRIDVGASAAGTYEVGTIPANAIIIPPLTGTYQVTDATPGGTTNNVAMGYAADAVSSANSTAYGSKADAIATSQVGTGGQFSATFAGLTTTGGGRPVTVDRTVTVTWSGSATTGVFEVIVAYLPLR